MLLFKYQHCGADAYLEEPKNEQKKPLVKNIYEDYKPTLTEIKDGDRLVV